MPAPHSATILLPDHRLVSHLVGLDARIEVWDWRSAPPEEHVDIVVPPYMSPPSLLGRLEGASVTLVQSQSIGHDGVEQFLPPEMLFANASSVHEASTAELALAVTLAQLRGIPDFVRAMPSGDWSHRAHRSLADSRVMLIGTGGVGREIARRLEQFEVALTRVGRSERVEHGEQVFGIADVTRLLPDMDVVILAVPLSPETVRLVDSGFLAAMRPGALLVNVARGGVVDTDALLHALTEGRILAAIDVVEPEPLPPDHPLWRAPGLLVTPHVGGHTSAMAPRMAKLVRTQLERLGAGEAPRNLVSFDERARSSRRGSE